MSYACACEIFGVASCRRPEFQCCWAQKPMLACCRCLVQHCWTREAARKRLGGCSGCGPLLARRSFFPSLRGGCASVVFTSDPSAPPIFQCCLQVVTANLLSHVRETTLTFGGAEMGLQLCNFCPVSAPLTNRRVAPSAESNPQQGLDLGSFFHAENGAAREEPLRCVRMKNGSIKFGCSIVFAECIVQGPRRRRAFWEKVCTEF